MVLLLLEYRDNVTGNIRANYCVFRRLPLRIVKLHECLIK